MPPTLPSAVHAAMVELAGRLEGAGISWVVTGSTGRALLGFDEAPDEIDAEMPEPDVARAAALVGLTALREVDERVSSVRARGTLADVGIDLCGGYAVHGPGGGLRADFALMRAYATAVAVGPHTVLVAPVEEQIARSVVAGREERLARIADRRPAGFRLNGFYLSVRLAAASAAR